VGVEVAVQVVKSGHHALDLDQAFEGGIAVTDVQSLDGQVEQGAGLVPLEFSQGLSHEKASRRMPL
jgi:hypothetical protein